MLQGHPQPGCQGPHKTPRKRMLPVGATRWSQSPLPGTAGRIPALVPSRPALIPGPFACATRGWKSARAGEVQPVATGRPEVRPGTRRHWRAHQASAELRFRRLQVQEPGPGGQRQAHSLCIGTGKLLGFSDWQAIRGWDRDVPRPRSGSAWRRLRRCRKLGSPAEPASWRGILDLGVSIPSTSIYPWRNQMYTFWQPVPVRVQKVKSETKKNGTRPDIST